MCADTHLELENPPEEILQVMCGDNSSGFVGTLEASIGGYRINLGVREVSFDDGAKCGLLLRARPVHLQMNAGGSPPVPLGMDVHRNHKLTVP